MHELAHDVLRHHARRLCALFRTRRLAVLARYARQHELEADAFAAWICGPAPMIQALETIARVSRPTPGPDLHPALEARLAHLRRRS